jgi:hypothetical protein
MIKMDVSKTIELAIKEHEGALNYFKSGDVGIIAWVADTTKDFLLKSEIKVSTDLLKILVKQEFEKLTEADKILN